MKKVFLSLLGIIVLVISYKVIGQYFLGRHYVFAPPIPFYGDSIVNPYNTIRSNEVQVANFHAHTKNGILNGQGSAEDVFKKYNDIGVDIHSVSQYHRIDTVGKHHKNYIPVYEHGYNLAKTHQLIIGAKRVIQKDYIFPQSIHNKQEILELLAKDTNNIVVLSHPSLSNGYTIEDLKLLHFYNHLEVYSPYANSINYWDTLLSAGKSIFIVANDDVHDIYDNNEIGRFVNLLYSTNTSQNNVINTLKSGSHAVVWLPQCTGESLITKQLKITAVKGLLQNFEVQNNTLSISFDRPVDTIVFVGQSGRLLASKHVTSYVQFPLPDNFTYVRVEARFKDGTKVLFNPVYKSISTTHDDRNSFAKMFVINDYNQAARNNITWFTLFSIISIIPFKKLKLKSVYSWIKSGANKKLSHD